MSRPGVTYADVANAANAAKGQGKNVTIENIRGILGTGSISTISNHLKKWKDLQNATQQIASKENLPEELVSLIKGLWERLTEQSQVRIDEMRNHYEVTIVELQESQEKYKANNQRWQHLFNQWQEEKNKLSLLQQNVEQSLQKSEEDCADISVKNDMLLQQLQEKHERINELHHLHKQTQQNLEHYRESAREQRILDQQHFEQQQRQYQAEIKALTLQSTIRSEKINELEQQVCVLQQAHEDLKSHYQVVLAKVDHYAIQLKEAEKVQNEMTQSNVHWQQQVNELQATLEIKSTQLIDSLSQSKTTLQQLTDLKALQQDLQAQNKLLLDEKWILAQEKSQLEGQLKMIMGSSEVL